MSETQQIPVRFEELTPVWLTVALRERGHLPSGEVSSVRTEQFGEGVGLMGQIARVVVEYIGAPAGTRTNFVVKIPALPGPNRQMAVDYRIYEKEVLFYERLAPRVPVRTPKVYFSAFNPENHDFCLLLEDLAPARVGSELADTSDDQVRLALTELARFHAHWWDTAELKGLDFVPYLNQPPWQAHPEFYGYCWPIFKEKFASQVSPYVLECGERFGQTILEMQELMSAGACTIIHMDYRLPNLFFGDPDGDSPFAVIDWQPYSRAHGGYDIGYFLAQSIPTEQRRRLQDEVLHLYHDTLLANGVTNYTFDDCYRDFRLGVMYTWLYPVGTVGIDLANEHGRRYQQAILERHSATVEDIRAGEVLPG